MAIYYDPYFFRYRLKFMVFFLPVYAFSFLVAANNLFGLDVLSSGIFQERHAVTSAGFTVLLGAPVYVFLMVRYWRLSQRQDIIYMNVTDEGVLVSQQGKHNIGWDEIFSVSLEKRGTEALFTLRRKVGSELSIKLRFLNISGESIRAYLKKEFGERGIEFRDCG